MKKIILIISLILLISCVEAEDNSQSEYIGQITDIIDISNIYGAHTMILVIIDNREKVIIRESMNSTGKIYFGAKVYKVTADGSVIFEVK